MGYSKTSIRVSHVFKKEISGKMKGRGRADDRPQRDYITKEELSSPTVSLYMRLWALVLWMH